MSRSFEIGVTRAVSVTNTYTVEADSLEEALRLAHEKAINDVFDYSCAEGDYDSFEI
jgi:hypothetical protein